ncbi:L-cystine-binding protein tcyA [Helicobacter didelphidarum]|uniref:L-cystine-binding protein tcyA n=1 Tax=Helicobacter didelphidarum TaxID=2040648 RepID=A0A3D8IK12_9HELI|nr:transporter substrate-binding domain-containing protein [Helicobacter didelphidarum]RDU65360.1 L-cystine-binding protein tcyA [Helicobacter didelphidarum]
MKKILSILFTINLISINLYALDLPNIDIQVGTGNSYRPFAYMNDETLQGYDVDVLRLLTLYDKGLNFHFHGVPWNAIFVGLESGKFNILAFQITKTPEREKKYIFSDYPYFNDVSAVITRKNQHIKSFNELNGQVIGVSLGSNYALNLEKYLKNHPELSIRIKYYKNPPALIADLGNNRIQAIIGEPISSVNIAKAQGIELQATDIIIDKTPVFFVFHKDNMELKTRISQALKKAIDDGKLSDLSKKYFQKDLTK